MSITNLTNTKWYLNETIPSQDSTEWNIYFALEDETQYNRIAFSFIGHDVFMYGSTPVIHYGDNYNEQLEERYRTITITGGDDVENAELIAFLEANATFLGNIQPEEKPEISITDLTNTKWFFNEKLSTYFESTRYKLDFMSNNISYTQFYLTYWGETVVGYDGTSTVVYQGSWKDEVYRTIIVNGGDDVTNPDLIAFLEENATQILDTPQITNLTGAKLKFLDVTNLENGSWQINFKSNNQNFTKFSVSEPYVETGYLTFSSDEPFDLTIDEYSSYDGSLEYSTDTASWTEVTKGTAISSIDNKVYLRGTGNSYCSAENVACGVPMGVFKLNGNNIKCFGNVETLLDYQTVLNGEHPVMYEGGNALCGLFAGCTSLVQAPALLATTLTLQCYYGMFMNCTSLTQAPALPATTLAENCYVDMFKDCTSLTQAPALPATTLIYGCYMFMFRGCTSLTQAPALPATTLFNGCYSNMFDGCTSLVQAPALPATTLAVYCYRDMFYGCTSLNTLPALPATTLTTNCYSGMFLGCTSIKLSTTQSDEYPNEYRIPYGTETGTTAIDAFINGMFADTGGTFTDTPEINVTYYTSNEIIK